MKKIFYLAIALTVLFAACKKEQINSIDKKIVMSGMSEIESDIIDFFEKIDEPIIDSLPVNDAVFFLEAGFNYRYAHAGNDLELTIQLIDTSFVSLDTTNGYSTYKDIKACFDQIYERMETVFTNINHDNKALSIIQVNLSDQQNLQIVSIWKYSTRLFEGDWIWGLKAGKCEGNNHGKDATDVILWHYDLNFSNPMPYGIWTNISFSDYYWGGQQLLYEPNNPYGYDHSLLFCYNQYVGLPPHCLPENENYFYASNIPEAMERIIDFEDITKPTAKIELTSDLIPTGQYYPILHRIRLIFGDFQSTQNLPEHDFLSE